VVALAGATGSGKSSLFNRLSEMDLSKVGVRRPTTGLTHACVWSPGGATELLEWLGIPPDRRFNRQPPTDDENGDDDLGGLVLLDLPDFDSVDERHRAEVDRLLVLVDLIVWVTDPQKYADQVIHDQYLRTFHRHHESTVVVLNQADRLTDTDIARCIADLASLLDRDGLAAVPTMAVSATSARPGIEPLRQVLRKAVAERMAALRRLAADVEGAAERLAPLMAGAADTDAIDRATTERLTDSLADSAGVPAVADAAERAYKFRAGKSIGWPLTRWLRTARVDPLRRLRLGIANRGDDASSLPPATPTQRSAATLAVRALADRAGAGLSAPWPAAVMAAARSHDGDLPDALDRAVVGTDLGLDRKPIWWRFIGLLQWLVTLTALAGAVWLLARALVLVIGLPSFDVMSVGRVPLPTILLVGGVLAGLLLSLLVKPLVAVGARRAGRRARARLHSAVGEVSRDLVVSPVRAVLSDYSTAKEALREARR
jgi:GTP-binding protein EngB required for normal cell division